jgi:hypothetical protein
MPPNVAGPTRRFAPELTALDETRHHADTSDDLMVRVASLS